MKVLEKRRTDQTKIPLGSEGDKPVEGLALAELGSTAGFVLAVLLTLDLAGVAGEEAQWFKLGTQVATM